MSILFFIPQVVYMIYRIFLLSRFSFRNRDTFLLGTRLFNRLQY